jgi:hypothetical protein
MNMILILVAAALILAVLFAFFKKRYSRIPVLKKMLIKAVSGNGVLYGSDIKKFSEPDLAKMLINKMIKDGVVTVNVVGNSSPQYMFPAYPADYSPLQIRNLDDFNSAFTDMGAKAEDGQIFLSEIIFAFDMEYDDIMDALESYLKQNSRVMRNVSKSGNIYFMFDNGPAEG